KIRGYDLRGSGVRRHRRGEGYQDRPERHHGNPRGKEVARSEAVQSAVAAPTPPPPTSGQIGARRRATAPTDESPLAPASSSARPAGTCRSSPSRSIRRDPSRTRVRRLEYPRADSAG